MRVGGGNEARERRAASLCALELKHNNRQDVSNGYRCRISAKQRNTEWNNLDGQSLAGSLSGFQTDYIYGKIEGVKKDVSYASLKNLLIAPK